MKIIILFLSLIIFPFSSFSGEVLKLSKTKLIAQFENEDDLILFQKGDKFEILDEDFNTVGSAKLIKSLKKKALFTYKGRVQKGDSIELAEKRSLASLDSKYKKLGAEEKTMSKIDYMTGGITGTLIGLGLGHFIQGRHIKGLTFLTVELGLVAFLLTEKSENNTDADKWGYLVLGVFRLLEIVDIWGAAINYKMVDQNKEITIKPAYKYNLNKDAHYLGASLDIKF